MLHSETAPDQLTALAEVEQFLRTHQSLWTDFQSKRAAPFNAKREAERLHERLSQAARELIDGGGEITLLARITTAFEKLGLIRCVDRDNGEFITERCAQAFGTGEDGISTRDGIRVFTAVAMDAALFRNIWTEDGPKKDPAPVRRTQALLLGFRSRDGRPSPRLGWTTGMTGIELEDALVPVSSRRHINGLEDKVYGAVWRFHELYGVALGEMDALHEQMQEDGRLTEPPEGRVCLISDLPHPEKIRRGEEPQFERYFPGVRVSLGQLLSKHDIYQTRRDLGRVIVEESKAHPKWNYWDRQSQAIVRGGKARV